MNWKQVDFDWNQAKIFGVVADAGSFSAAAKELGISQPTVGRQIAALEASLKITLFERHGKGLVLTSAGVRLCEHVKTMTGSASDFALVAQGESGEVDGDVRISLTELDAFFILPECIQQLRKAAPKIRLEIVVSNQISDLKHREADIAIRYQRPTDNDLIIKKLGTETVMLYGHMEYTKRFEGMSISQINDLSIIGFEQSDRMADFLAERGVDVSCDAFPLVCANQLVQWQLLQNGNDLALLPEHIARRNPNLVPVFVDEFAPCKLDIWLVTHRELHTSRRVRFVFDVLARHFSTL